MLIICLFAIILANSDHGDHQGGKATVSMTRMINNDDSDKVGMGGDGNNSTMESETGDKYPSAQVPKMYPKQLEY